jgi:hypothetical protein
VQNRERDGNFWPWLAGGNKPEPHAGGLAATRTAGAHLRAGCPLRAGSGLPEAGGGGAAFPDMIALTVAQRHCLRGLVSGRYGTSLANWPGASGARRAGRRQGGNGRQHVALVGHLRCRTGRVAGPLKAAVRRQAAAGPHGSHRAWSGAQRSGRVRMRSGRAPAGCTVFRDSPAARMFSQFAARKPAPAVGCCVGCCQSAPGWPHCDKVSTIRGRTDG